MSQFPSLKPSARNYTHGTLPVSTFQSMSGKETRVMLGSAYHGDVLSLSFQNVQESVAQQVLDHFIMQGGTLAAFTVPSAVWAGWDLYAGRIPSDLQWRYTAPPTVTAVSPGIMSLSVELVSLA